MDAEGLMGFVVGLARKKRWVTWPSSSIVAITAAAPAVYPKTFPDGRLSNALAEFVVVPMTWRSARLTSARPALMGERGVLLKNGDGEGFNLIAPMAGLIILGLEGVSDIASSETVEEVCDN
jgi:hypothetical protein